MKYQPFEFPFKKSATHAFPVWTNKQNPFVPKDNQLVCPNRESSPTLNIARCWCLPPHPFWQSHRKTLQNQWGGEERPSRKSLNAQTQPSFSWKSEKKFPTKSDAKNEIVSPIRKPYKTPFHSQHPISHRSKRLNGKVFRVSSKIIFSKPPPEPTKTVSEHNYEHTPTNCIQTNFPFRKPPHVLNGSSWCEQARCLRTSPSRSFFETTRIRLLSKWKAVRNQIR